jgi:nicotinamide riboside transporter PnuC
MKSVPYAQVMGILMYVMTNIKHDICYAIGLISFAGYVDDKNLQVNAYSYLVEWLFLGLRKKQGCVVEFTMELSTLHATQR